MAKSKKKSQAQTRPKKSPTSPQENTSLKKLNGTGTPRFDNYQTLIHRFYEPLILLAALGQTRGHHISKPHATKEQALHRRFLRNLAYVCDYEKGGKTTTAIGLEEKSDMY